MRTLLAAATTAIVSCTPPAATPDAASDVGPDSPTDIGFDGIADDGPGVPADVGFDAIADAGPDAGFDVGVDASDAPDTGCAVGTTVCAATCVDLAVDTNHCGSCGHACALAHATARCASGACAYDCDEGYVLFSGVCVAAAPTARPVFPPSTSKVTSRRPTFRWALGGGAEGARVEVCRDRACATVVTTFDAAGTSGRPPADLPRGVLFWRTRGRSGPSTGAAVGATWAFTVGARSTLVDTAQGTSFDVNGDGYADLAVGAPATQLSAGRVHVYLGGASGVSPTPTGALESLEGGSSFGTSLTNAGDLNGDGYADLGVAANPGQLYLFLGGRDGVSTTPASSLRSGRAVGAGDLDGDGYADLAVSDAVYMGEAGRALVYRGGPSGLSAVPSAILIGPDGGGFSSAMAGAGDVNGDGYADLVVGAALASGRTGRAYLYLGSAGGVSATPSATLIGPDGGIFGLAVASMDVNGDGYADVAVTAGQAGDLFGRVYVYLGGAGGLAGTPSAIRTGPDGNRTNFGLPMVNATDLNGDGYDELVIGASFYMGGLGRVYVYRGGPGGPAETPTTLTGPDGPGAFSQALVGAGDVNGDGYADLFVGAPAVLPNSRAYLYLGGGGGLSAIPSIILTGPDAPGAGFGRALVGVGPPRRDHRLIGNRECHRLGATQRAVEGDVAIGAEKELPVGAPEEGQPVAEGRAQVDGHRGGAPSRAPGPA